MVNARACGADAPSAPAPGRNPQYQPTVEAWNIPW